MSTPIIECLNNEDLTTIALCGKIGAMKIWQRELTETIGVYSSNDFSSLKDVVACMTVESSEALAHFLTSGKPWKPQEPDMDEVDEEMIDVLHYLLTYFNLREWSDHEIVRRYRSKNLRNFERISEKMANLSARKEGQNDSDNENNTNLPTLHTR